MNKPLFKLNALGKTFDALAKVFDINHTVTFDKQINDILMRDDTEAIASDWRAVGRDMRIAINQVRKEYPELNAKRPVRHL